MKLWLEKDHTGTYRIHFREPVKIWNGLWVGLINEYGTYICDAWGERLGGTDLKHGQLLELTVTPGPIWESTET